MATHPDTDVARVLESAISHRNSGRLADAEAVCRSLLEGNSGQVDALQLLGAISRQRGDHELAWQFYDRAIQHSPNDAVLLGCMGDVLFSLGRYEEAERSYRKALQLSPELPATQHNLGYVLQHGGRLAEAESCYRKAAALDPANAEIHNSLGNLLLQIGRYADAEHACRAALTINPNYGQAHNNLGVVLIHLNRIQEAVDSLDRASVLIPGAVEVWSNLGLALERLGRYDEAETRCRQATRLNPNSAGAHNNLGLVLRRVGRLAEAEESFRRAVDLDPSFTEALAHWVHLCQMLCAWSERLDASIQELRKRVAQGAGSRVQPFIFLALPETSRAEQLHCARQFAGTMFSDYLSRTPLCPHGFRSPGGRLRIGYLSGDFREHAASYLLAGVIEQHNRRKFEVFGYSYSQDDGSAISRRIRSAFDVFRDITGESDEKASNLILEDGVDILVELSGYTDGSRMQIAALRPAPVQACWIGYPGTLGSSRIADYLVGDPVSTPEEFGNDYAERLALLPHCYQPNDRTRPIGPAPARAEHGLPNNGFVFCCFNQAYKITPPMFELWCAILRAVPQSVLWLAESTEHATSNLRREARARGLPEGRLVFGGRAPLGGHLTRLQLADLALDTFPYVSHTTASDALWAGVPLVTILGPTQVSRLAASILKATGLPELIATDRVGYYRLAVALATHPEKLVAVRRKLADNRMKCPLFDSQRFARDIERLYEGMWSDYSAGRGSTRDPSQR